MRKPTLKLTDMFDFEIRPGDILAEVRKGYLLFYIPVDFTETSDKTIIHCKTSGYDDGSGNAKYGNKNVPFTMNHRTKLEFRGSFIATDQYMNNHANSDSLVTLSKQTHDWPIAGNSKKVRQKPFMSKWISSLKKNLELELKRVDNQILSRYRYGQRSSTSFSTSHDGENTYTKVAISRTKPGITVSIEDGKGYYSNLIASYDTSGKYCGDFEKDGIKPLHHFDFIDLLEGFCKENGIKI